MASRVRAAVVGSVLVVAIAAHPVAGLAAPAGLRLELPAPTGPYPVGVRSSSVTDPDRVDDWTRRARTIPLRVWYPAQWHGDGTPATYLSTAVRAAVEGELQVPPGTFLVETHAREGARARQHIRGVVLASPGKGLPVAFQTGQVVDLASRGWVVVAMDHPHDAFIVEFPDGTLVPRTLDGQDAFAFQERVTDIGVVLANLGEVVPEWRGEPVGIYGHSMGGAAAAEAVHRYPILAAGINLDGTPRGEVATAGLDEPFGIMLSDLRIVDGIDDGILAWAGLLTAAHPIEQLDVYHNGFTDFVVFAPQARLVDPAVAATFEAAFRTDAESVRHGQSSLDEQRRFIGQFMHRYLTR